MVDLAPQEVMLEPNKWFDMKLTVMFQGDRPVPVSPERIANAFAQLGMPILAYGVGIRAAVRRDGPSAWGLPSAYVFTPERREQMSGPKTGYDLGLAKAWATGHLIAAVAIAGAIGVVIGAILF